MVSTPFKTISMASAILITLLSIILVSPSTADRPSSPSIIAATCVASRDPPSCEDALTSSSALVPPDANAFQVIQSVLDITFQNLDKALWMAEDILVGSLGNRNLTTAAKVCSEVLGYSKYRIALTDHHGLYGPKIKDGRAWLSAALAYQYDGWSVLKKVNDTEKVINTMALINDTIIGMTSTALSMLANYDVHGENVGLWGPPRTERDGYWEPVEGSTASLDFQGGGVPKGLNPNVTVCKSGGCDYTTVQEAVNAAPNLKSKHMFVIWIKAGVYKEMVRVPLKKINIVLLGDGMGKTVITGSRHAGQPGMNTYGSATVGEKTK